jgi:carbamoyl-phosphate synthase large subunit
MTRQINVLVTGVGGRSVGHQVLQALLLAGDRYRIICTDGDAYSFGLYEVDSRYVVPLAEAADYCDAIEQIVERERIDVILIGTEAEIPVLLAIRARLAERGCLLIASPPEAVALCSDKGRLYRWLAAQGFGVPGSAGVADWKALVGAVGFPLIGKPARQSGGSRNVAILATT